jgi:hypothetical protein
MSKSNVKMSCPNCKHVFIPTIEEVQSRAGKSSRSKGHAFERRVAKQLQDWWNEGGKFNYEMKRCPQSGGSVLKVGFRMFGDVVSNAPDFKYGIECGFGIEAGIQGYRKYCIIIKFIIEYVCF